MSRVLIRPMDQNIYLLIGQGDLGFNIRSSHTKESKNGT